ncbi:dienelactone hydrolase family protein [Sphingobium sp.]|uniref:dienelactone hydrolase family protein n=1 Tax=Sphingobium sp. TaxID=1912891 RepID=UPI0028BEEA50|nr:dienelactone hydrolase family protein [Sphingobium sp.]
MELADGYADIFVAHPGKEPAPVVLFYMDGPGIREELHQMARRFAEQGYYVVLPDLYYRSGAAGRPGERATDPAAPEHEQMWQLIQSLTFPAVMADTTALLRWIDEQPEADSSRIAAIGYCMSGRFAITAAATWPDRIKAAASIYGTSLVTDGDDSPHHIAAKARGALYFGFAELDQFASTADIPAIEAALKGAATKWTCEVFPGVDHGFAFPNRATYDAPSAELHWQRLFHLLDGELKNG